MSIIIKGRPAEEQMPDKALCAAFAGHRPEKLPWGSSEGDPRCASLKLELAAQIRRAYAEGRRYFISGMAEGVDLYAAEAVLRLSSELEGIRLIAVFPYGFGSGARQRRIAESAYMTVSLYPEYVTGCMHVRDRFLAEHCGEMICAVSSAYAGGTAAVMKMAAEAGVKLTVLGV